MPVSRLQPRPHASVRRGGSSRGFTLIELLAVIAIIGVLAALTFGVVRGVRERSRASQARAEMAVISAALEAFKRQYGDYPQTGQFIPLAADPEAAGPIFEDADNPQALLYNALIGKFGPKPNPGAPMIKADLSAAGRSFIEAGKLRVEISSAAPLAAAEHTQLKTFLDPWGRRYRYFYKNQNNPTVWEQPAYLLYSVGPDNLDEPPSPASGAITGVIDYTDEKNADNIYAHRP